MVNHVDRGARGYPVHVEIREALEREHDEIGRVTAEAYRDFVRDESYLQRIADVADRATRTQILVATDGGAIVGSLTLELSTRVNADDDPLESHRAHIRMLGVAPAAQGRGVGRALMREAERRAVDAGKREMTLHTTERILGYAVRKHGIDPARFRDRAGNVGPASSVVVYSDPDVPQISWKAPYGDVLIPARHLISVNTTATSVMAPATTGCSGPIERRQSASARRRSVRAS